MSKALPWWVHSQFGAWIYLLSICRRPNLANLAIGYLYVQMVRNHKKVIRIIGNLKFELYLIGGHFIIFMSGGL